MLLCIQEWKDSKVHVFEMELFENIGMPQLKLKKSKECYSIKEVEEFIDSLNNQQIINYNKLTLDYNNKKYSNVRSIDELRDLIVNQIIK